MKQLLRLANNLVIAAVLFTGMSTAATADEVVANDQVLPADTTVYLTIHNVNEFKSRWGDSLYGQLQQDPALADFWEQLQGQLKEASREIEEHAGVSLDDLMQLPQGEVSLAVFRSPGQRIAVVALMNYGDNETTVDTLLEKMDDAMEEGGADRSVEEFDDTEITVFELKSDAEPDPRPGEIKHIAYFRSDSVLAFSTEVYGLETVLARWDGQHSDTLASGPVYQYIGQRCRPEGEQPVLSWYIDPIKLISDAVSATQANNPGAQMMMAMLPSLGVTRLKGIGGSLDLATEEFDSVSRTLVYVEQPPAGVLNVFQFPAVVSTPPEWVSAETNAYFGINWDLEAAFNAVETLVDGFQGPGATEKFLDKLADEPNGPKLHVKNDFLDFLDGRIHVVTDFDADTEDEEGANELLVALGLKDTQGIQATLTTLENTDGFPGTVREFRGTSIYELQGPQSLVVGVTNNNLVLASKAELLEAVIRNDGSIESLADSDEYRQFESFVPSETSGFSFQKQDAQIQAAYEMMKSMPQSEETGDLDFSTLPPFEEIKKYLRPTVSYLVPDERGAFSMSFSLAE